MKQYITVEQLDELSEEGKEQLRKWWKPKQWDRKVSNDFDGPFLVRRDMETRAEVGYETKHWLPLLSIGQMIEFLDDHEALITIVTNPSRGNKDRLCDNLWENVKEVLEGEVI